MWLAQLQLSLLSNHNYGHSCGTDSLPCNHTDSDVNYWYSSGVLDQGTALPAQYWTASVAAHIRAISPGSEIHKDLLHCTS